ncbi:hypothetical protein ES319_D06G211900v1 [Gossypium barbadense]|uniref:Uncharacterized protein n=2 Tax=Gossypium TaxID=3633 RepID=A0A5J5R4C1_GOSBA|nr:hypothetical protein ES319_D06G211900v1 [Gossypium barbadense]TYG65916.1 hypothetical protein ES288_D06G225200v1 [Gossypium darwinii]
MWYMFMLFLCLNAAQFLVYICCSICCIFAANLLYISCPIFDVKMLLNLLYICCQFVLYKLSNFWCKNATQFLV